MGESSARQLRGESMADVIFAGSHARTAAALATVELTFDNTAGRVGGRFGNYEQIQVKRSMDREGVSSYFLNGTRCRRRDIKAVFMGTGLGSRSYSIIEQGMIARLIEAKPEVLGAHLEEAAQISGYRQSRKETETRMRATKENLSRLRLLIDEVDKQMASVRQQAATAKKYSKLKADEQRLQTELTALSWQEREHEWSANEKEVSLLTVELESSRAGRSAAVAILERFRREVAALEEQAGELQKQFYQDASAISQLEQELRHDREQMKKLTTELSQMEQRATQQKDSLGVVKDELLNTEAAEQSRQQQALEREQEELAATEALSAAVHNAKENQERNEHVQTKSAELHQRLLVLDERCDSSQLRSQKLIERQEKLEEDLRHLSSEGMEQLDDQRRQLAAQTNRVDDLIRREHQEQERLVDLRRQGEQLRRQAADQQDQHRQIESRLASLQEAQKVALRADKDSANAWLEQTGLSTEACLADRLRVPSRWRTAVETVLNIRLRDLELADPEQLLRFNSDNPSDIEIGAYAAGITATVDESAVPGGLPRLRDLVSAPALPASYLAGVCVAADLAQALAVRPDLQDGQSVITADGIWLGRDWLRMGRPVQAGVLDRAAEIQELIHKKDEAQRTCAEMDALVKDNTHQCERKDEELHLLREELRSGQEDRNKQHGVLVAAETRDEHRRQSSADMREKLAALADERERLQHEHDDLMRERSDTDRRLNESREKAEQERLAWEQSRELLEKARNRREQARERRHEIALGLETIVARRESLKQVQRDRESSLQQTEEQCQTLHTELSRIQENLPTKENQLQEKLKIRETLEQKLNEQRRLIERERNELSEHESSMEKGKVAEQALENQLQEKKLQGKEARTKMDMLEEQLATVKAEDVLSGLNDAEPSVWREKLETVERQLQKMGGVNLAAIEELEQLDKRRTYLDKQNNDLEEALATLTKSIRHIDTESRNRFQETFTQVNENFQKVFAHLFGGGQARLIVSGTDGQIPEVQVQAQPPGKRRGSIHMLSGGEKALTAIALVFAIFQLNPAPLCLLDEVDAPLDDYNVKRYMDLVADMAEKVQFIFITHNKITMEMADVLLGITMGEAGVSRIVGVDMEMAVQLTDDARDTADTTA